MNPVYVEGTSAETIIEDGWSRGFAVSQTVEELHAQGFTDIDEAFVKEHWKKFNDDYLGVILSLHGKGEQQCSILSK